MSWIIVCSALALYAFFWSWYVGFGRRVSVQEIDRMMVSLSSSAWTWAQQENARQFMEADDGKDCVTVNLVHVKEPRAESRALLTKYSKAFLGALFKRAGHPLTRGRCQWGP